MNPQCCELLDIYCFECTKPQLLYNKISGLLNTFLTEFSVLRHKLSIILFLVFLAAQLFFEDSGHFWKKAYHYFRSSQNFQRRRADIQLQISD